MTAHNCGKGAGGRGFKNGCGRVARGGRSWPPRTTIRGSSSAALLWSTTVAHLPARCGSSATTVIHSYKRHTCRTPLSTLMNALGPSILSSGWWPIQFTVQRAPAIRGPSILSIADGLFSLRYFWGLVVRQISRRIMSLVFVWTWKTKESSYLENST